jgi:hypothetical protein
MKKLRDLSNWKDRNILELKMNEMMVNDLSEVL